MVLINLPSENCNREVNVIPKYIIIHCIGFSEKDALKILTKKPEDGSSGVSANYFIPVRDEIHPEQYEIFHLVDDNIKAFHAGISKWQDDVNLNSMAIGIEFHSPNYANAITDPKNIDFNYFEYFPENQIKAGICLIKDLMIKYKIPARNVLPHSDISPWRTNEDKIIPGKTDPGTFFPWQKLAKENIGIWPKKQMIEDNPTNLPIKNIQQSLQKNGYNLDISGVYDDKTHHCLKAFQMHYTPHLFDKTIDKIEINDEMVIALENLANMHIEAPFSFRENLLEQRLSTQIDFLDIELITI